MIPMFCVSSMRSSSGQSRTYKSVCVWGGGGKLGLQVSVGSGVCVWGVNLLLLDGWG